MAGEHLDVWSDPPRKQSDPKVSDGANRFVGITFACCGVYSRVYRNREGTAYAGYCPKCSRPIRLVIGPGGTDSRFFTAE